MGEIIQEQISKMNEQETSAEMLTTQIRIAKALEDISCYLAHIANDYCK